MSGQLWSQTQYSKGLKNGSTVTYFENGNKRYEGAFTKDLESGKWKFWNQKGEKLKETDLSSRKN